MDLISIYNEYVKVNNEYMNYIFELSGCDLGDCSDETILERLKAFEVKFEDIKIKADVLEVDEENMNNLQDLKYFAMDALFAGLDLANFYSLKEVERFKMRAVNYVNKKRRAEIFNESRHSECRVDF